MAWTSRGLRGSTLEEMINRTNEQYRDRHLALIQKVPTPITPIKIDKESRHITLAYFEKKSTVDYWVDAINKAGDLNNSDFLQIADVLSNKHITLSDRSLLKFKGFMKKNIIQEQCDYPENNSLYIMLLSGNLVDIILRFTLTINFTG